MLFIAIVFDFYFFIFPFLWLTPAFHLAANQDPAIVSGFSQDVIFGLNKGETNSNPDYWEWIKSDWYRAYTIHAPVMPQTFAIIFTTFFSSMVDWSVYLINSLSILTGTKSSHNVANSIWWSHHLLCHTLNYNVPHQRVKCFFPTHCSRLEGGMWCLRALSRHLPTLLPPLSIRSNTSPNDTSERFGQIFSIVELFVQNINITLLSVSAQML